MVIPVGLVGYGLAAKSFHAPLIQSVAGLELAAVVTSRSAEVARALPRARVAARLDEVLADPAIELVVIASPTAFHFEQARAALLAGKHVIVDKPIATSVAEADTLIALAAARERMLTVFHNRRWDGDYLTVQYTIAQGWLGNVATYEAHYDRFRPAIKQGWREEELAGSGVLYDLGTHLVDQAIHLFGMPASVTADVFAQRPAAKVPDYFHVVLAYERMRAILHSATLVAGPGPRFQVHGDRASFLKFGIDGQEAALRAGRSPGGEGWGADVPEHYGELVAGDGKSRRVETLAGAYPRFYEMVVARLRAGGPLPVDPQDARDGLLVLTAAMQSARERRTITLPR
jgi:scyllo-inositol 2-dehydrogenase (NADP+)